MPRQDPAYLYEQTQERTLHEKNLKIEDLERQADAFQRDVESASARIAALEAELDFALNFLQRENSGECIFQRNSYVDIRLTEARALLNGGGK